MKGEIMPFVQLIIYTNPLEVELKINNRVVLGGNLSKTELDVFKLLLGAGAASASQNGIDFKYLILER